MLALTALLTVQGARTGLAQWLVFTPDIPGVLPVGSTARLARAARLAPNNGSLALWVTTRAHEEFLSSWLSADALAVGDRAAREAARNVRALPADPYSHIEAAAVMLDRARHPLTEPEFRGPLRNEAIVFLYAALDLYPSSSDVGHRVAHAVFPVWALMQRTDREVALRAVHRVGQLDRLGFPRLLEELAHAIATAEGYDDDMLDQLDAATPETPNAQNSLALLATSLARSSGVSDSWARQARGIAVRSYQRAALASGFHPHWSQRWIETASSLLPELLPQVLEQTRLATTANPLVAGAWLARAFAADAARDPDQVREAAEQARELARADLARRLEPAAERGPGSAAMDARLLALAEVRLRALHAADRQSIAGPREAIAREREAIDRNRGVLELANGLLELKATTNPRE